MEKQLQTIRFDIKSFDEEDRSFMAVGSTDAVDRHGETISQDGWDLENFKANPVILYGHDYYNPPIAKCVEIGVVDNKLMFRPKFATADEYAFADTIYKLYKGGYMRSFSVGFVAKEMEGETFTKMELLEISAVTIPANPEALALAYKEGVINETERKSMIAMHEKSISTLTNLNHKQDNDTMEDKTTTPTAEELTALAEKLAGLLAEIKEAAAPIEKYLAEIETKATDEATDDNAGEEDANADEDQSAKSEDEALSDGSEDATDADAELTPEEAEKFIADYVAKAMAEMSGKVE